MFSIELDEFEGYMESEQLFASKIKKKPEYMILQYLPCHTTSNSTEAFQTLLKLTKAIWNLGQKIYQYVANWFTSKHIRQLLDETLWRRCNDSTKYVSDITEDQ